MDDGLRPLTDVLTTADSKLQRGESAGGRVWATGFSPLDEYLSGGIRSGELVLVGGQQGLGKTMFVLQAVRNIVDAGGSGLYFSYEHDDYTVLERLLSMEAGLLCGFEAVKMQTIRAALEGGNDETGESLEDRLLGTTGGVEALHAVRRYSDRLFIARSNGSTTDLREIAGRAEEIIRATGESPVVVVDYLQKVPVPGGPDSEDDRITHVTEGLKDLALRLQVPVVAVVASEKSGLTAGKRLRVHDLRGSTALAYEPDVILLMNDKYEVVARHHLVFNTTSAERYREWAVVTIEKNRSGQDNIDLEFQKLFDQGRFNADGQLVVEQLVDERVFTE